MPTLKTKSTQSEPSVSRDGLRLLVTRFIPRGCTKKHFDVWMPNLSPSEPLLKAYQAEKMTWAEFARCYKEEIFEPAPIDKKNTTTKNHGQKFTLRLIKELASQQKVTLLCRCDEKEEHCHRHLLKAVLESAKI